MYTRNRWTSLHSSGEPRGIYFHKRECLNLFITKNMFPLFYEMLLCFEKTARSILFTHTHTHTHTHTLSLSSSYTQTQILPCRDTFLHRHFFPLLSDCDLVSEHSSSLAPVMLLRDSTGRVCCSLSVHSVYVCVCV